MKTLEFINIKACDEAAEWASGKTWKKVYSTCHRGDWLLWLFKRTNPKNIKELTLAKGHCANTVRHLMNDQRSIDAVDAAISFGEGRITEKELYDASAYASADSAAASSNVAANVAADAAYASAYAADSADNATDVAADAYASAASAAAYDAAKKENQQQTADICRKYFPIEMWNI